MNPRANEAYSHIHGAPAPLNTNLETISPASLAAHNCSIWLMSPPCQPYTSLSGQADAKDPRSKALRHIFTHVLPSLADPPQYLAIENVPAFLWSEGRRTVVASLQQLNYDIEEFELCPTLFGIPNKRRRYFMVAKRVRKGPHLPIDFHGLLARSPPSAHENSDGRDHCAAAFGLSHIGDAAGAHQCDSAIAAPSLAVSSSYDVKYFLPSLSARADQQVGEANGSGSCLVGDEDLDSDQTEQCLAISREGSVVPIPLPPSSSDQIWGRWQPMYASPLHHVVQALPVSRFIDSEQQLHAWAAAGANCVITEADLDCISRGTLKVDVARRCSVTTSCFTKGYARILRRAGPLFLQRHGTPAAPALQRQNLVLSLRRFTPSEQARLMCLPDGTVEAHADVSPQNWHKLLGNSVNVHVCACVLLHMLRDDA
jgi:site-specific DNA-cytosine methylase